MVSTYALWMCECDRQFASFLVSCITSSVGHVVVVMVMGV